MKTAPKTAFQTVFRPGLFAGKAAIVTESEVSAAVVFLLGFHLAQLPKILRD